MVGAHFMAASCRREQAKEAELGGLVGNHKVYFPWLSVCLNAALYWLEESNVAYTQQDSEGYLAECAPEEKQTLSSVQEELEW